MNSLVDAVIRDALEELQGTTDAGRRAQAEQALFAALVDGLRRLWAGLAEPVSRAAFADRVLAELRVDVRVRRGLMDGRPVDLGWFEDD
jgi:Arc/MetJ-type ribon-helix-helix transcriptional regulator